MNVDWGWPRAPIWAYVPPISGLSPGKSGVSPGRSGLSPQGACANVHSP